MPCTRQTDATCRKSAEFRYTCMAGATHINTHTSTHTRTQMRATSQSCECIRYMHLYTHTLMSGVYQTIVAQQPATVEQLVPNSPIFGKTIRTSTTRGGYSGAGVQGVQTPPFQPIMDQNWDSDSKVKAKVSCIP